MPDEVQVRRGPGRPRKNAELVQSPPTSGNTTRNGPDQDYLGRVALRMAGFKPKHLRKALDRTIEALDAEKPDRVKFHGEFTQEKSDPDHKLRLAAANEVFKMIPGMYAKEDKSTPGAAIAVEIVTLAPDGTRTAIRLGGAASHE